jgi:hypothetical protein
MAGAHTIEARVRKRIAAGRTELEDAELDEKYAEAACLHAERELQRIKDHIRLLKKRKVK